MKKHARSFALILLIALGGKFLGFFRELVMAYCFGTGETVDTFLMAESLPSVFFGWTTAFATAFVPVYQTLRSEGDEFRSRDYLRSMMGFLSLLSAVFVALGIGFAGRIIDFGASGFTPEQKGATYGMYVICTLSYLYYSQIQLATNYLNCREQFLKASLPTLLISPIQTLFVVIAYGAGKAWIMALGVAVSLLAQLSLTLFWAGKEGFAPGFAVRLSDEVKQTVRLALPLFISSVVTRLNVLIDKMFASTLPAGSISALSYGEVIRTVFFSLMLSVITSMFFPLISKAVAEGRESEVAEDVNRAVRMLLIAALPLTALGMIFARWGTAVVYLRGSFDMRSLELTAIAFSMYMLGLTAMLFREICTNYFQSCQNTRVPLYICSGIVALNILLDAVLIRTAGYYGLPLATSLANLLLVPVEAALMRRRLRAEAFRGVAGVFGKTAVCTALSSAAAWAGVRILDGAFFRQGLALRFGLLLGVFALAGLVYLLSATVLRLLPRSLVPGLWRALKSKFAER